MKLGLAQVSLTERAFGALIDQRYEQVPKFNISFQGLERVFWVHHYVSVFGDTAATRY